MNIIDGTPPGWTHIDEQTLSGSEGPGTSLERRKVLVMLEEAGIAWQRAQCGWIEWELLGPGVKSPMIDGIVVPQEDAADVMTLLLAMQTDRHDRLAEELRQLRAQVAGGEDAAQMILALSSGL